MDTEQKQIVRVHIRWMIRRDMPEVVAIEEESFEFPWLEKDFIHCLRQNFCIGMVAEHDDRIVGFMIYELYKDGIHVLSFAVHPDFRRQGIGNQMIEKLIDKLLAGGKSRIMLAVRETNTDAQLFFRECGFRAVSVLRKYYEDIPEDAYLMLYRYKPESPSKIEKSKNLLARIISRLTG